MDTVISSLAAILYLLATAWLAWRLMHSACGALATKGAPLALAWSAVLLHAMLLAQTVFLTAGLNLGFFSALSFTAWLIGVLLLVTAMVRPVENLGILILPFCALTLLLNQCFPGERIVADTSQWPLELHILIAILAYSLFTLAAAQAVFLALQEHRLRHRQPGGFLHAIPPLTAMESLLFQMLTAGFVLLSITLVSGWFFIRDISAQHLTHKALLSCVAWLVFGVLLWGRWRFGWRGRKAIHLTLSGFTVLALAYFGSKLVLELVLQRY